MCTYGIGLPFDHPIWQNLPPCRCGLSVNTNDPYVEWRPYGFAMFEEAKGKKGKKRRGKHK